MALALNQATADEIVQVFDEASQRSASQLTAQAGEREMTGAFVGELLREADVRGLDIEARSFSDTLEGMNGADIGIAISGPARGGGRATKGFIAQAKRDDEPGRLSGGASELCARRGKEQLSQLQRLCKRKRAGAVIVYGRSGITAIPASDLPRRPSPADLRGGDYLPDLVRQVLACTFGLEGRDEVWDLFGLTPKQREPVQRFVHIRA